VNLEGRTALVTGGARRIGASICEALAAEGARVVIHCHRSVEDAQGVRGRCPDSVVVEADLRDRPGRLRLLAEATRALGPLDILVNNAAIYERTPLAAIDDDAWDRTLATNLKAPFFLARDLGLAMKRAGSGAIVNLTDWAVKRPYIDRLPYFAAKAGLEAMTVGLARALAPEVRVNAVAPGAIMPTEGLGAPADELAAANLLGRLGGPEPVVSAVLFLLRNDFVTGTILPVDGGRSSQ